MEKKKGPGAPPRYVVRVSINHSIEESLLNRVRTACDLKTSRTDFINSAIEEYLKKYNYA